MRDLWGAEHIAVEEVERGAGKNEWGRGILTLSLIPSVLIRGENNR
jgi:hypothetical protein